MALRDLVASVLPVHDTNESTHWCGGTLVFIRKSEGGSLERCGGCGWFYDFDHPSEAVNR